MSSPDIFLSYNREDAARAKHFADGFAAEGFNVWWDVDLRSGEAYDQVTEKALRDAKAVVVLWSPRSVESRWCRAEATLADRNKTLMPAMIEPCERPIMFELVQTAELSHWQGDRGDAAWKDFALHVRDFIGKEASTPVAAKPAETLPGLDQLSVAVLPFANMSRDEDQEYFADGMTEDIITDLSKISALGVIARNTAFTFKGKHVDVADVARKLNVTHVLEGSVRKAGNRVRVTAQLIDGSNNNHVWAERYDRDLDDIFELQDELSKAIVDALKVKLLPGEDDSFGDRGTQSQEAYDIYCRVRASYFAGNSASLDMQDLVKALRQAVKLDPGYSDAWLMIATCQREASFLHPANASSALQASSEAYDQAAASAKDPLRAAIIKSSKLGTIEHDWIGAGKALEEADRLAPGGKAQPHMERGLFYCHVGRLGDAVEEVRACMRLDPMLAAPFIMVMLDAAGRSEEAIAENERQRRLLTFPPIVELFDLIRSMAFDDAATVKAKLEAYLPLSANFLPKSEEVAKNFEDKEMVARILEEAAQDPDFATASQTTGIAIMAAYFGLTEFAAQCLRTAFTDLKATTQSYLWHPLFKEVRQTEAYKQLIREQGFYDYWRESGHWSELARPLGDDDFEMIG